MSGYGARRCRLAFQLEGCVSRESLPVAEHLHQAAAEDDNEGHHIPKKKKKRFSMFVCGHVIGGVCVIVCTVD